MRFDFYTIGHSNHPIDRFIGLLQAAGATAIADVRSIPGSRRYPWFTKQRLAHQLEAARVAYGALGDTLGGRPSDSALLRDGIAEAYRRRARAVAYRGSAE